MRHRPFFIISSTSLEVQQRVDTLHFRLLQRYVEMLYLLSHDGPLPARQKVANFVQYGEPANKEALANSMGLFCLLISHLEDEKRGFRRPGGRKSGTGGAAPGIRRGGYAGRNRKVSTVVTESSSGSHFDALRGNQILVVPFACLSRTSGSRTSLRNSRLTRPRRFNAAR